MNKEIEQLVLTDTVRIFKGLHPLIESPEYFPERFLEKVEFDGECWLWRAAKDPCGYGQFYWNGRPHKAHRVAYALTFGAIPKGKELDHLCRVRHCVRPSHLDPVSHRENVKRGIRGAITTHCPQGHPYDEANTAIQTNGARRCRACSRAKSLARAHAARALRIATHGPISRGRPRKEARPSS